MALCFTFQVCMCRGPYLCSCCRQRVHVGGGVAHSLTLTLSPTVIVDFTPVWSFRCRSRIFAASPLGACLTDLPARPPALLPSRRPPTSPPAIHHAPKQLPFSPHPLHIQHVSCPSPRLLIPAPTLPEPFRPLLCCCSHLSLSSAPWCRHAKSPGSPRPPRRRGWPGRRR